LGEAPVAKRELLELVVQQIPAARAMRETALMARPVPMGTVAMVMEKSEVKVAQAAQVDHLGSLATLDRGTYQIIFLGQNIIHLKIISMSPYKLSLDKAVREARVPLLKITQTDFLVP
jgi:hypothetical protein